MHSKQLFDRFLILEDPSDETWCVIHESGILVADSCPTYEDAFIEMVRIGGKIA